MKSIVEATSGISYIVEEVQQGWAISDSNGSLGTIPRPELNTPLPKLITMHVGYRHLTQAELDELNRNCNEQIERAEALLSELQERQFYANHAFNTK